MFDLDSDEEEVDFADDDVFEMVSKQGDGYSSEFGGEGRGRWGAQRRGGGIDLLVKIELFRARLLCLVVFEFDMQTILNPHLHLDAGRRIRWHPIRVHPQLPLLQHLANPPCQRHSQIIPIRPSA